MGDNNSDNGSNESGWDTLAVLLWPVLKFMDLKVWLHNKIHPDDPEAL